MIELAAQSVLDLPDGLVIDWFELVAIFFGICVAEYMAAGRLNLVGNVTLVNPADMEQVSVCLSEVQDGASAFARSSQVEVGVGFSLKRNMLAKLLAGQTRAGDTCCAPRSDHRRSRVSHCQSKPRRGAVVGVHVRVWLELGSKDLHQALEIYVGERWTRSLSSQSGASVQPATRRLRHECPDRFDTHLSRLKSWAHVNIINNMALIGSIKN